MRSTVRAAARGLFHHRHILVMAAQAATQACCRVFFVEWMLVAATIAYIRNIELSEVCLGGSRSLARTRSGPAMTELVVNASDQHKTEREPQASRARWRRCPSGVAPALRRPGVAPVPVVAAFRRFSSSPLSGAWRSGVIDPAIAARSPARSARRRIHSAGCYSPRSAAVMIHCARVVPSMPHHAHVVTRQLMRE